MVIMKPGFNKDLHPRRDNACFLNDFLMTELQNIAKHVGVFCISWKIPAHNYLPIQTYSLDFAYAFVFC